MEDLKKERSNLKRRVTVLSTRIRKAVQKKLSLSSISSTYNDLENTYLYFLGVDEEYNDTLLQEDETLREEYEKVGGMSLEDYTASVDKATK